MLRALVLILLLLNAVFFGWTRGWLDDVVGLKARGDREPERMARQLHPERIQLLAPQAAAALQTRACLTLSPLNGDAALQAAQAVLQRAGIAAGDWQAQTSALPGVWAVATIKLPSKDFQARKEDTYKKLKLSYEFLQAPADEMPSLLLSRHTSEQAANAALEALALRALKGLRVLQLQAPMQRHTLLFAQADGALQARLRGLGDAALAAGFKACAAPAAASAASAATAPASAASAASQGQAG